jgi:hypothetical protein
VLAVKKQLLEKSETKPYYQPQDLFMVCNGKPLDEYIVNDNTNHCPNGVVTGGDGVCRPRRRHYYFREGTTVLVSYRTRGGGGFIVSFVYIVSYSILTIMIGVSFLGGFYTCGISCLILPFLVPFLSIVPLLFWLFAEELPLYVVLGVPLMVPLLFVFWLVRNHELETKKKPRPQQTWR